MYIDKYVVHVFQNDLGALNQVSAEFYDLEEGLSFNSYRPALTDFYVDQ